MTGIRKFQDGYPSGATGPAGPTGATGPTGPAGAPGSTTFAALTDVTLTSPANDDIVQRKAGVWVNRTMAQLKVDLAIAWADVSGAVAAVNALIGSAIITERTATTTYTGKDLTSGTNTFPTFNQSTTGSAATLTTSRTIGTLTGDVTSAGSGFNGSANNTNATTLATVNSNVGAFGSASSVATFTVNGKGLTTAAAAVPIQIAESQVTNLVSDLAAKAPLASPAFTGTPTGITKAHVGLGNVANVDQQNAANLTSGTVGPARLGSGSGGSTKFLREDSTWQTVAGGGSGDVVGPASAVNNNLVAFDTTTGKLVKDSGVLSTAVYRSGGTDVPIVDGGTGASTAAQARVNLGLAQPMGIHYKWDTNTTIADPGAGWIRYNSGGTPAIAISTTDADAVNRYNSYVDQGQNVAMAGPVFIRGASGFAFGYVGSATNNTTWYQFSPVYSLGSAPFANGEDVWVLPVFV